MSRILTVDVGAGTMDILYYDTISQHHYKAVAKSPILYLAERVENLRGNLLITGVEMGGGSLSRILEERVREREVVMSVSSSATIHHNPEKVRGLGIRVVEDQEADYLAHGQGYQVLTTGDLQVDRLQEIIEGLGLLFSFDVVAICAQDHGRPPTGVSHLDYRHSILKATLDTNPFPHALLYRANEIPKTLSRLYTIGDDAKRLPTHEIYVMDSGMAAVLGASMDSRARGKKRVLMLDVATSHTLGAALEEGEVTGFFEYHTRDITLERLEGLLQKLADGELDHRKILEEGGHGAYVRKGFGFEAAEVIVVTGPKRRLMEKSRMPIVFGAPLGDNMMTGAVGLLEAVRRRKGFESILYL